ncbi:MAG: phosphatidylserine decarboxylase [Bauldia sp.]|nr:phosphatidylserine decarboxylase [Bauldia sp.]
MDSILGSIRKNFVPVRREGYVFIAIAALIAIVLGFLWQPLFWIFAIVTGWVAYFFRDPRRVTPQDANLVISPADGTVAAAGPAVPPEELGLGTAPMQRVSVFMSVFNCHVNRAPVAGRVTRIAYRAGKFINADLDKASVDNERNGVVIDGPHGHVGVVQIAGLVARRILCWTAEGADLSAGQRFGMIRFGSRVDVYLPASAAIIVSEGQTVLAGETTIAWFGGVAGWPVRVD